MNTYTIKDIFDKNTADDENNYKNVPKQEANIINPLCRGVIDSGTPGYLTSEQEALLCKFANNLIPKKTQVGCFAFFLGFLYISLSLVVPVALWVNLHQKGYEKIGVFTLPFLALTVFIGFILIFTVICIINSKRQKNRNNDRRENLDVILKNINYKAYKYPVERVIRFYSEPPYDAEEHVVIWFMSGGVMFGVKADMRNTRTYSGKLIKLVPEEFNYKDTFTGVKLRFENNDYFVPFPD